MNKTGSRSGFIRRSADSDIGALPADRPVDGGSEGVRLPTSPYPAQPAATLTPLRATFLMVGAGVGAGIMAVPLLAERVGVIGLVAVLFVAYGAALFIHLMLVEVLLRTGTPLQVVELMRLWVLDGKDRRWVLWLIFSLLSVAFMAALAAYVAAQSEILTDATGLPLRLSQLLVYMISAGVVFFGLRAVGIFETIGSAALIGCVITLAIGALGINIELPIAVESTPPEALALFSMVMYGYYAFFSVPQVVKGLAPDGNAAARAVTAGLAINGVLIAIVALVALGVSTEVTEVAIVGISDELGRWAGGIGEVFVFVALLTSYWTVSLALADIINERIDMGFRSSWLVATLPSLLLLYVGAMSFLDLLQVAAGTTAIVIAAVTVPMYVNARAHGVADPDWSLGRWGSRGMLGLALVATVLMALGSLSSV
jgi:amino acid permease